jgi:tRNA1Val (adenine37-N6)-methyltransferase
VSADAVGGEVDVVFSNPPYMRTDSGKRNESDRKYIARHEVCGGIDDFCHAAARMLKHGGKFYCVWRPDRLSNLMAAMRAYRLEPKTMVFVHGDVESEPSMVLLSAIKGGASGMRVLPPLCLHDVRDRGAPKRALTARAQEIYDTMSFYESRGE